MSQESINLTPKMHVQQFVLPVLFLLLGIGCIFSAYFGGYILVLKTYKIPIWGLSPVLFILAFACLEESHFFSYLRVNSDGIAFREGLRSYSYNWRDIDKFGLYSLNDKLFVGIVLGSKGIGKAEKDLYENDGYNILITPRYLDTAEDLLLLLKEWKNRQSGG